MLSSLCSKETTREWILSDFSREKLEEAMLIFNKPKYMNYPTAVVFKKLIFNNLDNFNLLLFILCNKRQAH